MWREALRWLQIVGGIALGVGSMAAFLWSIEWRGLAAVLGRVSWTWVAVAAAVMIADYAVHGLRFRLLLRAVAPGLDWSTTWRATTVMWAGNTLLPLRAGLVLRALVVTHRRPVSLAAVLSVFVAETVCDLVGIVGLLLTTVALLPAALSDAPAFRRLRDLGSLAGGGALVLLALVVLLSSPAARQLVDLLVRRLPGEAVRGWVGRGFDQVVVGMAVVRDPGRFAAALAWTGVVWVGWWLGIVATLRAFGIDVGASGALFLETALTLSMLVPQAPGFLGVFQVVTEEALSLFGAPEAEAEAVALLFWTLCFVPVTALGVVDAWRSGVRPSDAAPR